MITIKRLTKKSNNKVKDFLKSHVLYNETNQDDIKDIISLNSDCVYTGKLYRGFVFSKDDFENFNSEIEIKNRILLTNNYNSCSNDINSVRNFTDSILSDTKNPFTVIIEFDGIGLDIKLLVSKYYMYGIIDDDLYDSLLINLSENEIVSIVPNNYTIIDIY